MRLWVRFWNWCKNGRTVAAAATVAAGMATAPAPVVPAPPVHVVEVPAQPVAPAEQAASLAETVPVTEEVTASAETARAAIPTGQPVLAHTTPPALRRSGYVWRARAPPTIA